MLNALIAAAVATSASDATPLVDVFSPSFGEQIARDRANPKTQSMVNFVVFTDLEIAGMRVCRLPVKEQNAWTTGMHLTDGEASVLGALCGAYLTGLVDGLKESRGPK